MADHVVLVRGRTGVGPHLGDGVRDRQGTTEAGGVDLQLLGIGTDGHIGFNEPCSSLVSRTRIKTLTEQTRVDNARFFDDIDQVPHHVITQGIGTILEARHLVLLATGEGKADAVAATVEGPVAAVCPASALHAAPARHGRRRRGRREQALIGKPRRPSRPPTSARKRFPALRRSLVKYTSLYTALAEVYDVHLAEAEETIETSLATPREAGLLGTDVGLPMLMLSRHSLDRDGQPVEWVRSVYRGDRYKFVARLKRPQE
ncbi:Glucosamine-6-phosphate deaminase [Streptomyces hirsutus]